MKKTLLSAFAALAVLSANAQEISTSINRSFDFVPAVFSCNKETIILEGWRDTNRVYYQKVLTGPSAGTEFRLGDYPMHIRFFDLDNCTYVSEDADFTLTQNLFNDDEYFEWLNYEGLHSSNGTLSELPAGITGGEFIQIYKINGAYYMLGKVTDYSNPNRDYQCHLYLIDRKSSSLKTVAADAPEAQLVYSLSGRRQKEMQQGINIVTDGENGPRKVLKR